MKLKRGVSLSFFCIIASMKKMTNILFLFFLLVVIIPFKVYAQQNEKSFKGIVIDSKEVACSEVLEEMYVCFEYTVKVKDTGEEIVTSPTLSETGGPKFVEKDKVIITFISDEFNNEDWSITGYDRNSSILVLIAIFSVIAIVIGRRQGIGSLISLAFTVLILYVWAVPKILGGSDVIFIGVSTVILTLLVIMYASHGFNKKTTIATVSSVIGIIVVGVFAKIFSNLIRVDGSGSEEAFLLSSQTGGSIDLAGVFFISILIGAMGVLDDVVMSQVSAIQELYRANDRLTSKELYKQAMNIGRDHISSMVNTLFIAYAGSSLAVVMLLTYSSGGIENILKIDVIAEEIVRTLTASIGILAVVPISSFIAANLIPKSNFKK